MALKMLEMGWDDSIEHVDAYFLDLLKHRDVSGLIAEKLNIEHQSPQMLVLRDGKALSVSNHSDINVNKVKKHL